MENNDAPVLSWIIKRDSHEPDDVDIDFLVDFVLAAPFARTFSTTVTEF